MGKITELYGELVFDKKEMRNRLSPTSYEILINAIENRDPLDISIAEDVARAMKDWAIENGATHFTHWFQPQRTGAAEKHDAFLSYGKDGEIIEKFSSSQLIQSEPDASSFPSGGIRSTFEARGYTAWNPSSPAFLRDAAHMRSLVIPSIYMSWTGEALDQKTPLIRSINALNSQALKLQRLLGNRTAKRVKVFAGFEQEYFLLHSSLVEKRPDLMMARRTLFGAPPIKGQLMEDHYFGTIKPRVLDFMNALDQELYRYGIPVKTKHNEVAPNQFELAPMYEEVSLAIDHNLQMMEIMKRVAEEHDLVIFHHEKPFAGLNGSGKHMNWSLGDNTGANYLEPSKSPLKNINFLLTLAAIFIGIKEHGGLLRAAISDAGNEHRLGSHEAPPAILSIYLGEYLTEILDHIEGITTFSEKEINHICLGLQSMPKVVKDTSDRNRTSPIAFTGNKFELRALGSNANGSNAATIFNTVCAYGFQCIIEKLEKMNGKDTKSDALVLLKDILKTTKSVRFEGNNYSDDWKREAVEERGLYFVETTPESYLVAVEQKSIDVLTGLNIFSKRELESRVDVKLTAYSNTKFIELKLALRMVRSHILPSVEMQIQQLGQSLAAVQSAQVQGAAFVESIQVLDRLYSAIVKREKTLQNYVLKTEKVDVAYDQAYSLATKGKELLADLRSVVDEVELLVASDLWRLPGYDSLLRAIRN